jgi:hypothetical protein
MPWDGGGDRKRSDTRGRPEIEDLLKRGQDKLRQGMPSGSGLPGSIAFLTVTASLPSSPTMPSPFA